MREIKFRAFQINFKRMLRVESIHFTLRGKIRNVLIDNGINVAPRYNRYGDVDKDFPLEAIILMQFTGLHDKCGKEIYEGDIVKHPKADAPEDLGWIIIWRFDGWWMKMVRNNISGNEVFTRIDGWVENAIVIGNIHENPELLQ